MKVEARACARVDLAGGTLDLWPLYLLHPGSLTVNLAIAVEARATAREIEGSGVEIRSADLDERWDAPSVADLPDSGPLSLLAHLVRHLRPQGGVSLETGSVSPPGAGLGASSALAVAVTAALQTMQGERGEDDAIVRIARDCETRALGFPAGSQDYWPALRGGLLALHWEVGGHRVEALAPPAEELASRLAVAYTGEPHHSGMSNWAVYRARMEEEPGVAGHLDGIRDAARDLREALQTRDWGGAGEALRREWEHRRLLAPAVSTPRIDELIEAGIEAGAFAGKVCGAGGGGCVLFLGPEGMAEALAPVLAGREVDPLPASAGGPLQVKIG